MPDAADRWTRIERVYHSALDCDPGARDAFLREACADDEALRLEVLSLLACETDAARFLTQSAIAEVAGRLPAAHGGLLIGRQIHGYDIRSLLGAGGMGEVYLAHDLRLGRDVALKILRRAGSTDPAYLRRFEDEARSASGLNHPNIVTIYGVGEDDDLSYIAMEYVRGRTLGEVIATGGLGIAAALDLAVQLADGLAAAHEQGIVHRDLKPDNAMVTAEGLVKILDFSIARREGAPDTEGVRGADGRDSPPVTEAGQILGTVGYMSPEQAQGLRASPASDQFSFGAILYELLCGRRAFERPSRTATLEAIRRDEPEPIVVLNPRLTQPLLSVMERCLAKDPARRYGRTRELAAELRAIRDRLQNPGLSRRQAVWLGTAATVTLASMGALGWSVWSHRTRVLKLALLPFENAGGDPEIEHFCNGLTDNLILRIGELPGITVMTHSLVSNFKRSRLDAREFARSIGADSVLTGTIERQAGNLTIRAALLEVMSGKVFWSYRYTRSTADFQDVQDVLAREIVDDGIRLQLSDEDRKRLVQHETDNPEAYELYLRALLLHERQTPDDTDRERDLLEQAIGLDPKFAKAYATLGGTWVGAAIDGWRPPAECWQNVLRYAGEARRRNTELPDVHATIAMYEFYGNWRWDRAEEEWKLALRPRGARMFPDILVGRAFTQWALGRSGEAVKIMAEVRNLDPLSPAFIAKEAHFLMQNGEVDRAAAGYEAAIRAATRPAADPATDPTLDIAQYGLAHVRYLQGRYDEAIDIRKRLETGFDPQLDRVLANARGAEGYRAIEEQRARIGLAQNRYAALLGQYVAPIDNARLSIQCGDKTKALKHLDAAMAARDPGVLFLRVDNVWAPLRGDPRFEAAIQKLALPA